MPLVSVPRSLAATALAGTLTLLPLLAPAAAGAGAPAAACRLGLELDGPYYGMGYSVGAAGDVNGDGYADFIVGAFFDDMRMEGEAYVYFGGPAADASADLILYGRAQASEVGFSVGTAGDFNGDGYDDMILGARLSSDLWGYEDAGRAHLYFGGASPDTNADLVLVGEAPGDFFGLSVSTAGDMNGDGYADVVIGARGSEATGRAYVYFGGPDADATPDLTLTGEGAGDQFGYSVASAGDLNGDGYGDVVVGAYTNDAGGSNAGRIYVYYGGTDPDATADLIATGTEADGYFGSSVAGAGDTNGDGYDDLLAGASGVVHVFHGGASPDATTDLVLRRANELTGAVSTAGDVNGDGFDDVLVGSVLGGSAFLFDFQRYFVLAPDGGETWDGGSAQTIAWLGAEPADLWISADGGATYERLASAAGGSASDSALVTVPPFSTTQALVRLTPSAPAVGGSDVSDAPFTIQVNGGVPPPGSDGPRLRPPWPNPSGGVVRLALDLPEDCTVTLSVFDLAGREVARPIPGERFAAGAVTRTWRPGDLPAGVYSLRARVGGRELSRRLVWLVGR